MDRKAVIVVVSAGLLLLVLVLGYLWLDVWSRFDATVYAPGFTESGFRRIQAGMAAAEVQRILGKPLANDTEGHVEGLPPAESKWFYAFLDRAKIPEDDRVTNTWFQVREIDFDGTGRVVRTVSATEQFE